MRFLSFRSGLPLYVVASVFWTGTATAVVADRQDISIVSATFGTIGTSRKLDISRRLAEVCGAGSVSCQVFCSETSFGRYNLGRAPLCRVTYRCGTHEVRSVEAMREEPLLLRCSDGEAQAPSQLPTETN